MRGGFLEKFRAQEISLEGGEKAPAKLIVKREIQVVSKVGFQPQKTPRNLGGGQREKALQTSETPGNPIGL